MTPRQLDGYLHFAGVRLKRVMAGQLALHTTAARGKPDAIKRILKEAERT